MARRAPFTIAHIGGSTNMLGFRVGGLKIRSDKRVITGDKELDQKLRDLGDKKAKKVSGQAVNRGLTVIQKEIQKAAIAGLDHFEMEPKDIKQAIGKRFAKAKRGEEKGLIQAKVGVAVGAAKKTRKNPNAAWWLHFFAMGTADRFHRSGKWVGRLEQVDFVGEGFRAAEDAAEQRIREALRTGIEREAKKP